MTRFPLPHGRYAVRDGGHFIVYDRPGFVLGMASEDDPEALEEVMALVAKLAR